MLSQHSGDGEVSLEGVAFGRISGESQLCPRQDSASFSSVPLDTDWSSIHLEDEPGRNALREVDPECFCKERVCGNPAWPLSCCVQGPRGSTQKTDEKPSLEDKVCRESIYSLKPEPRGLFSKTVT